VLELDEGEARRCVSVLSMALDASPFFSLDESVVRRLWTRRFGSTAPLAHATVRPELFEFVYTSRFHVHVPCAKSKPLKLPIRITKTKEMLFKEKDQFPCFTDLTIQASLTGKL